MTSAKHHPLSRDEAIRAMREVVTRTGAIAKDVLASGETRTLAAAVSLLTVALDARLSALESERATGPKPT